MSTRTLLLNPWMNPHKVISWQTAVTLFYLKKVDVLEEYEEDVSSPSVSMKMPAVVRLNKALDTVKRAVKFSQVNVFMRDNFKCQYCGERKPMIELNYDHVVPRFSGGKTTWDNIVTSCYPCNGKKRNRTPEQAGMRLLRKPFRPKTLPMSFLQLDRKTLPKVWEPYCRTVAMEEDCRGLFLMTA